MTSSEIRNRFLKFFEARGHAIVPSSSLVPDDPSVLLTTAGMQQFKKYYTGEADAQRDFGSHSTVSIQKCFRTSDIDEVGDDTHNTFFEMLGNFSFGGYWKKEAIECAHDFIVKEMGLPISYVTIFKGSDAVPKDEESRAAWNALGVQDVREEGMKDVFWGPTGSSGPCGPTTEIYCKNAEGKDVEIWNLVFNEFFFPGSREELLSGNPGKQLEKLNSKGVDTGMGLERLAMTVQSKKNIFETDLFAPFFDLIHPGFAQKTARVIADHARAIAFLAVDGVRPANKEAGYILRRLIRRIVVYKVENIKDIFGAIVGVYTPFYSEFNLETVISVFAEEQEKFNTTIYRGLEKLAHLQTIDAPSAFTLYESYGLPYETIKEIGGERAKGLRREDFDQEFKKHQEISRAGAEKKFGGHGLLLNTGELKAANEEELKKVTRLHTATHLLQAALRKVLGDEVQQRGSDITAERLRFDFAFSQKLTPDEISRVENEVNEAVQKSLPVQYVEMPLEEAKKTGALYFFKEKYPENVKVYTIGPNSSTSSEPPFSREFCGGPHVSNTAEVGHFKITKEESTGAGIRRIRATVL